MILSFDRMGNGRCVFTERIPLRRFKNIFEKALITACFVATGGLPFLMPIDPNWRKLSPRACLKPLRFELEEAEHTSTMSAPKCIVESSSKKTELITARFRVSDSRLLGQEASIRMGPCTSFKTTLRFKRYLSIS